MEATINGIFPTPIYTSKLNRELTSLELKFVEKIRKESYFNGQNTTSNNNFRKNHAGIGMTYDEDRDAFIPKKPFNSWILNEDTCNWESPVAMPTDGNRYNWNETNLTWDLIEN